MAARARREGKTAGPRAAGRIAECHMETLRGCHRWKRFHYRQPGRIVPSKPCLHKPFRRRAARLRMRAADQPPTPLRYQSLPQAAVSCMAARRPKYLSCLGRPLIHHALSEAVRRACDRRGVRRALRTTRSGNARLERARPCCARFSAVAPRAPTACSAAQAQSLARRR